MLVPHGKLERVKDLSLRQAEALRKLSNATDSAYCLSISLATLTSLQRRGLVVGEHRLGSVAMPHTHIRWRLTPSGRKLRLQLER